MWRKWDESGGGGHRTNRSAESGAFCSFSAARLDYRCGGSDRGRAVAIEPEPGLVHMQSAGIFPRALDSKEFVVAAGGGSRSVWGEESHCAGLGGWDDSRGGVLCGDASAGGDPGRTEPRDLARGVCAVAWSGEEVRMKLALCLEYPISQFGGTEVLVSELIRGLKNRHEIVLVSPDKPSAPDISSLGKLSGHVMWQPGSVSQKQSRELAANLEQQRVSLAQFH